MTAASEQQCPSCGKPIPAELGQHADNLLSGRVNCPHCGAAVTLGDAEFGPGAGADVERAAAAPPGQPEEGDSFSGQETAGGVAEELRDKPT